MTQTTADTVRDKLNFIREKERNEMEKIIIQTQKLALDAIEKERKVENMIELEEEEKENSRIEEVKKKFEKVENGKVKLENKPFSK